MGRLFFRSSSSVMNVKKRPQVAQQHKANTKSKTEALAFLSDPSPKVRQYHQEPRKAPASENGNQAAASNHDEPPRPVCLLFEKSGGGEDDGRAPNVFSYFL